MSTTRSGSRIEARMAALKAQDRKALIPFITAGFPKADSTVGLMHALVRGGADIIELGVPFSDPSADGPVIQRSSEVALANGVGLTQVLASVAEFRKTDATTPVVLMGYANPIERYEWKHGKSKAAQNDAGDATAPTFIRDAAAAGVDGMLVVDYPPEECVDFATALRAAKMDLIFLLAPTSTDARIQSVGKVASGYVYYVSLKGVTGSGALDVASVTQAVPRIRAQLAAAGAGDLPVGVGFGIRDAESAKAVGAVSDAVVIGSKLIQIVEAAVDADTAQDDVEGFLSEMVKACA